MIRAISITGGIVASSIATALSMAYVSERPFVEAVRLAPMSMMIGGVVAGALFGNVPWVASRLGGGNRNGRTMLVGNAAAWLLFVLASPRVGAVDGDPVVRQRAALDAEATAGWPNGISFVSHPPSLLAGRPLSWVRLSEKPLALLAGPAVAWVEACVVQNRYWQTGPTIKESYLIAAIAFALSTTWWATVAPFWAWLRNGRWRAWMRTGGLTRA